jgi:S-adenosyl-L-methionine hydrolase (adenosine-forming)
MPILTITSDIGPQDFLTGAIKGRLLSVNETFNIVDISHSLDAYNYPQAAYVCRNAFRHFPSDSFHLVLVNMFDVKSQHLLLARHHDQYIGIADNGLLTMILETSPEEVVTLPMEPSRRKDALYYTEVFGEAFTALLSGRPLDRIGIAGQPIREKHPLKPLIGPDWIEGQIIFIDHFENVVVNIRREDFEAHRQGRSFKIVFRRDEVIDRISETYAEVPEGEKTAIFNAAGYLEVAINKGNAAGLFGLQRFKERQSQGSGSFMQSRLFYQTVRVYFES